MAMNDLEELKKSLEIETLQVNSECLVNVTHIVNPHKFYTRLTKHRPFVERIHNYKPTLKPVSVNKYDKILFNLRRVPNKQKYVRGIIIEVKQAGDTVTFDICAIDYGYIKKGIALDQIWTCDQDILSIPGLAMRCRLANCEPRNKDGTWGLAVQAFKTAVGDELAKIIVQEITSYDVRVILINSLPDDIATVLVLADFTFYGYIHTPFNTLESYTPAEEPQNV